MAQQTVDAIFENGVFRPLIPASVSIPEGHQVQLIIRVPESSEEILALAMNVYAGLTEEEVDEIEQIALDRREFFSEEVG